MKKYNKRRSKLFKLFFFGIIIIYFIYKFIFGYFFNGPLTEAIEYGELNLENEYECLIIRQESIVTSPSEGDIKYFVEEGEKVEKGFKIAEVLKSSINEEERENLNTLSQRILDIQNQESTIFDVDINKIDSEIDLIVNNIRVNSLKDAFINIPDLKQELADKLDKKRRINGDKSFSGSNLHDLEIEKNRLQEKIDNSVVELYSPESGIISYHIDGAEKVLTPENIYKVKNEYIQKLKINPSKLRLDKVIYNQPVFKVIDNTKWYVVVITNNEDSKTFKVNNKVFIKFEDKEINGFVENIHNSGENSLVVIEVNSYAKSFLKERKMNLQVIKEKYSGLKINKDSIIEKDGQLGVYVLDINRKAIFKPIKAIGYQNDVVIVEESTFYIRDGNESKRIETVKLYDEILRNAKEYTEGDIIY